MALGRQFEHPFLAGQFEHQDFIVELGLKFVVALAFQSGTGNLVFAQCRWLK